MTDVAALGVNRAFNNLHREAAYNKESKYYKMAQQVGCALARAKLIQAALGAFVAGNARAPTADEETAVRSNVDVAASKLQPCQPIEATFVDLVKFLPFVVNQAAIAAVACPDGETAPDAVLDAGALQRLAEVAGGNTTREEGVEMSPMESAAAGAEGTREAGQPTVAPHQVAEEERCLLETQAALDAIQEIKSGSKGCGMHVGDKLMQFVVSLLYNTVNKVPVNDNPDMIVFVRKIRDVAVFFSTGGRWLDLKDILEELQLDVVKPVTYETGKLRMHAFVIIIFGMPAG